LKTTQISHQLKTRAIFKFWILKPVHLQHQYHSALEIRHFGNNFPKTTTHKQISAQPTAENVERHLCERFALYRIFSVAWNLMSSRIALSGFLAIGFEF
jgi:hypothetical protein